MPAAEQRAAGPGVRAGVSEQAAFEGPVGVSVQVAPGVRVGVLPQAAPGVQAGVSVQAVPGLRAGKSLPQKGLKPHPELSFRLYYKTSRPAESPFRR